MSNAYIHALAATNSENTRRHSVPYMPAAIHLVLLTEDLVFRVEQVVWVPAWLHGEDLAINPSTKPWACKLDEMSCFGHAR